MNKKIKILSIMFFFVLIFVNSIFVGLNDKKFKMDGILFAVTLNGKTITEFPERGRYNIKIRCKNAVGKWLTEDWKFVVENIKGDVSCSINFTDNPQNLKTVVENNEDNLYEYKIPIYDSAVPISKSEYTNASTIYNTSYPSTTGTTTNDAFSYSEGDNLWSTVPGNLLPSKYYHLVFNPPGNGYYKFCYTLFKGSTLNYISLYVGSNSMFLDDFPSSGTYSTCVDVGYINSGSKINVVQKTTSSSSSIAKMSFNLKKVEDFDVIETHYRFKGEKPNNYVWFNDELWRIIGSVPTKIDDTTTKNLVKLVRENFIGGLAYDGKSSGYTSNWGSNTLYTLLNNYYYDGDSDNNQNATGTNYCNARSNVIKSKCDYSLIGFSKDDYYGKMIKEVFWNNGSPSISSTSLPSEAYSKEISTKTQKGYIGLVSATDYAFANSKSEDTWNDVRKSWLYYGGEWTLSKSSTNALYVSDESVNYSKFSSYSSFVASGVRPVVYLDENVYVVSGDGTEANPYQIAM